MKIYLPSAVQEEEDRKKAAAKSAAIENHKRERKNFLIAFLVLALLTIGSIVFGASIWVVAPLGVMALICAMVMISYGFDDDIDRHIKDIQTGVEARANLKQRK